MADKVRDPCIRCGRLPAKDDAYCTDCGAPLVNRCSDEPGLLSKGCKYVNPQTAAYCAKCGEPTVFNRHGLVVPIHPRTRDPGFFLG